MNPYLRSEPATDADAVFRNFMRHSLSLAAGEFGLTVITAPHFGWRLRSVGARVARADERLWLRVVSQECEWAQGDAWTGTLDANGIGEINKPRVLDVHEWSEGEWRTQRAELMTLLPGNPCSPVDLLRAPLELPESWWRDLSESLARLATVPTQRQNADQTKVTERITERFGTNLDTRVTHWETVHGDLHWSNVMGPRFGLLDWELWGRGPAGTDAATLLLYSLLAPPVAAKVCATFSRELETPTGGIAQLYVGARLLRRIDGGDYPELAEPIRTHARAVIDQLR